MTLDSMPWLRRSALATIAFSQLAAAPGGGIFAAKWQPLGREAATVTLSYRSEKLGEGRMSVQLGPEGERFAGEYLCLDGSRPAARLEPHFAVWASDEFSEHRRGPAGQLWNAGELTLESFRKRYSGAVIATLEGNRGSRMRCTLALVDPRRGLPGGASGACQVSNGDVVTVPAGERR